MTGTPAEPARPTPARAAVLVLLGAAIGTWSALCGIGGGVFAVPLLHYVFRLPLKVAVGSSLLLVAGSTSSATIAEVLRGDSALHTGAAAALVVTSLLGARAGFWIARRLDATKLKAVFVVVLAGVALDLVLTGDPRTSAAAGEVRALPFSPLEYVEIAGLGLLAGLVAPILGVGGGLVAVPGLLFVAPGLGYLGARATSMAMSLVTSWQSVLLYRREKQVALGYASWLAVGAIVGGWLGVALVHVSGATSVARGMLAATLAFVSVRFALDVARARNARAAG
ncbi:MAG: sulfite exporter TauE/SafE family protein [Planctomycetota bacterium]